MSHIDRAKAGRKYRLGCWLGIRSSSNLAEFTVIGGAKSSAGYAADEQ